jgi:hypothetical protein
MQTQRRSLKMDPKQLALRREYSDKQQAKISRQMTYWAKKQMTKSKSALKVELKALKSLSSFE